MKWNWLPAAGGLYDQSPKLLDDFDVIWGIESREEKRKEALQERERSKKSGIRNPRKR